MYSHLNVAQLAFLLDHSPEYKIAHLSAVLEYIIESLLFPSYKNTLTSLSYLGILVLSNFFHGFRPCFDFDWSDCAVSRNVDSWYFIFCVLYEFKHLISHMILQNKRLIIMYL